MTVTVEEDQINTPLAHQEHLFDNTIPGIKFSLQNENARTSTKINRFSFQLQDTHLRLDEYQLNLGMNVLSNRFWYLNNKIEMNGFSKSNVKDYSYSDGQNAFITSKSKCLNANLIFSNLKLFLNCVKFFFFFFFYVVLYLGIRSNHST